MKHNCRTLGSLLTAGWLIAVAGPVSAVPRLQLDIEGGVYDSDPLEESVVTYSDEFTLYAYGRAGGTKPIDLLETHYVSIALTPLASEFPVPAIGSFIFDGITFDIDDMIFGIPPIEISDDAEPDSGDLAPHSVFETYFIEYAFNFDSSQIRASVNVQDNPGTDPFSNSGSALYFMGFDVDASNLASGYYLHFDLYDTSFKDGDTDVDHFAPFSHDASYVPEPGSLMLFSIALLGLGAVQRRKARTL